MLYIVPYSLDFAGRIESVYTNKDKILLFDTNNIEEQLNELFIDLKSDVKIFKLGDFDINGKRNYIIAVDINSVETNEKFSDFDFKKNPISEFYQKSDLIFQFSVLKLTWLFLK